MVVGRRLGKVDADGVLARIHLDDGRRRREEARVVRKVSTALMVSILRGPSTLGPTTDGIPPLFFTASLCCGRSAKAAACLRARLTTYVEDTEQDVRVDATLVRLVEHEARVPAKVKVAVARCVMLPPK